MHVHPLSLAGVLGVKAVLICANHKLTNGTEVTPWHNTRQAFYHQGKAVMICVWVLTVSVLLYQNAYSCWPSQSLCKLVA